MNTMPIQLSIGRALLRLAACSLALSSATAAFASSPAAWAQHDKAMAQACAAATGSELKSPKPLGKIVMFSDELGLSAVVMQGRYAPRHMKNRQGRELCLYDRKSGTAHVAPADQLGR